MTSEQTSSDRAERFYDLLDVLFIKRRCGWCGELNRRGEGHQQGATRWCSEEHAFLDWETAA